MNADLVYRDLTEDDSNAIYFMEKLQNNSEMSTYSINLKMFVV